MTQTMFERLGGMPAIRQLVATFYEKVAASPRLSRYFDSIDMQRLIDHQTLFFAGVSGSPITYDDSTLWHAHAALRISRDEFAEVAALLTQTLEEYKVGRADIDAIVQAVASKEMLVVNETDTPPER